MAILNKGQTFSDGEQVTSTKLNTAVDGATFAAGAVDDVSTQLSGGAIIVKDGGVTTAKIADDGVTTAKIADSNITTSKIADNNVITSKIADSNVTTAKITDSGVTTTKIADDAVTTSKIADSGVTTAKIADSNVTTAKIADSNITTAKIANDNVTTSKIANNNVTTSKIANSNITTEKIANSNVTKGKIENVANMKVLGNTSGSSAAPQEVSILDEDNMSSNSNTAIPTQQSVKSYVGNNSITKTNGTAPYYGCRAWGTYNGQTNTLKGNGNISSVSRTGTGYYTVYFSTQMTSSNYAVTIGSSADGSFGTAYNSNMRVYDKTTSSFKLEVEGSGPSGGKSNQAEISFAVFA